MKLESIELENFRCFHRLRIDCSKFTLLTGANSSGKSSIMMSLLGALQTNRFPFYFSPNGSYVNMGDFIELSHNHDAEAEVRIALRFNDHSSTTTSLDSSFIEDSTTKLPRLKKLSYTSKDLEFEASYQEEKYFAKYRYDPAQDSMAQFASSPLAMQVMDGLQQFVTDANKSSKHSKKSLKNKPSTSSVTLKDVFFPKLTSGAYTFGNASELFNAGGNAFLARRIGEMCNHTIRFGQISNYISSFRLPPERTYYQRTKSALKIEKFGENWIDQIVEWEQSNAPEYEILQKISKRLGLANLIKAKHYGGGRYEMRVSSHHQAIDCALNDVGFGVSQFLPLIVADLQLGKGSTFMVSQPEIHLHPEIQAEYINHLASLAKKESKAYIIETHSEYMLNRFRLLIAKGQLSPDDVSVYYLTRQKGKVSTHNLRFEKDGSIKNAPKDFFKTYMMDTVEIALHAES